MRREIVRMSRKHTRHYRWQGGAGDHWGYAYSDMPDLLLLRLEALNEPGDEDRPRYVVLHGLPQMRALRDQVDRVIADIGRQHAGREAKAHG